MTFEDKLIIENALSLWVGCILYHQDLFNDFLEFKGTGAITDISTFILTGLLYCPHEKIREEFRSSLEVITRKLRVNATLK